MTDEANDLEARKNELFATITLLAGAKRDLIGVRGQRRLVLIERQAQLEADKERLSHEVNSQYMYRNLQAFMNRVDDAEQRLLTELGGLRNGQTDLQAEFRAGLQSVQDTVSALAEAVDGLHTRVAEIEARMDGSQEDRQLIHTELAAVKNDVARLQERLDSYIRGSKRDQVEDLRREIDTLKQAHDQR